MGPPRIWSGGSKTPPMVPESRVVAIHQPEFLPWLGFLDKLRQCDTFVLLDHVQFEKNYFQNRNRIRTVSPRGWSWVTVPVLTKGRSDQPICDVEINKSLDWKRKHLEAFRLHYGKASHFGEYGPSLQAHYEKPWRRLADFSVTLIEWIARSFGLQRKILRSSEMNAKGARSQLLASLCEQAGATEYLSGISGRNYLETDLFEKRGIQVRFQEFHHPVYRQCYEPFVPGLSSLDLLFNGGGQAGEILASDRTPRLDALFT